MISQEYYATIERDAIRKLYLRYGFYLAYFPANVFFIKARFILKNKDMAYSWVHILPKNPHCKSENPHPPH